MGRRILLNTIFMLLILLTGPNTIQGSQVLNEIVDIEISSFVTFFVDVNDSATATVWIEVISGGDITLLLLNESSYNMWNSGDSIPFKIYKEDINGGTFTSDLSDAGRYYLILDNSDGWWYNVSLSVTMDVTYPPVYEGDSTSYIIGSILLAAVTAGLVVYFKKIQKKQIQLDMRLVCESCNLDFPPGTKFCIECGEYLIYNHDKINNKYK